MPLLLLMPLLLPCCAALLIPVLRSLVRDLPQFCTVRTRGPTLLWVLSKENLIRYAKPSHFAHMQQLFQRVYAPDMLVKLRAVPFLSQLSPRELALLASLFDACALARGDLVCREGEPGSSFYFIVDGAVQVVAEGGTKSQFVSCEGFLQVRKRFSTAQSQYVTHTRAHPRARVTAVAVVCRYCVLRNNELCFFDAKRGHEYSSAIISSETNALDDTTILSQEGRPRGRSKTVRGTYPLLPSSISVPQD